jgi:hypothetical protein
MGDREVASTIEIVSTKTYIYIRTYLPHTHLQTTENKNIHTYTILIGMDILRRSMREYAGR